MDGENVAIGEGKTETEIVVVEQQKDPEPDFEPCYMLISSADDFTTGKYVIVAEVSGTSYAMPISTSQKIDGKEITVSQDIISTGDATDLVWEITKTNDNYTIKGTSLLGWSSSTNFSSSGTTTWKVKSVSNSIFTIANTKDDSRAILFQDDTKKFGPYSTTNNSGYTAVKLYKYTEDGNVSGGTADQGQGDNNPGTDTPGQGGDDAPGVEEPEQGGDITQGQPKTVIFDFENETYGLTRDSGNGSNDAFLPKGHQLTKEEVVLTFNGDDEAWRLWTDGLREYYKKNPTFTVSAGGKAVTAVSWTVVSGATFKLEGTDSEITQWEGSETSVTFVGTASANKAVKTITITYLD
ncbi:MAG: hypothetical protein J1F20_05160 [Muribaculaceae bacterium]|nr:hypothetical protein [Muribaculaceae bacterium]